MAKEFQSFEDFYPYYLSEHSDPTCRRLHFVGSIAALVCLAAALVTLKPGFVLLGLLLGYGMAWIGHFFFENNKPATFQYPWMSFKGDWVMFRDMLTGKIKF